MKRNIPFLIFASTLFLQAEELPDYSSCLGIKGYFPQAHELAVTPNGNNSSSGQKDNNPESTNPTFLSPSDRKDIFPNEEADTFPDDDGYGDDEDSEETYVPKPKEGSAPSIFAPKAEKGYFPSD